MLSQSAQTEITEIVGEKRLLTDSSEIAAAGNPLFSPDASDSDPVSSRGPAAIVCPENESQVVDLIQWARRNNYAFVPFGAGSAQRSPLENNSRTIAVDMNQLEQHFRLCEKTRTLEASSSWDGQKLERKLRNRGYTLGHYPKSLANSTVGGWLATRSAYSVATTKGRIEDAISSIRVVTGTADIIDTKARDWEVGAAPGPPDLTQLFVGSQGTLGLITMGRFQVRRLPEHMRYRAFYMPDLDAGLEALRDLMQAGLDPCYAQLSDPVETFLYGSVGAAAPGAELDKSLLHLLFEGLHPTDSSVESRSWLSDLRKKVIERTLESQTVSTYLPRIISGGCRLLIGFEGRSDLVARRAGYANDLFDRYGTDLGAEPTGNWLKGQSDRELERQATSDLDLSVGTLVVSADWSHMASVYRATRRALAKYGLVTARFTDICPEGSAICFHFVTSDTGGSEPGNREDEAWEAGCSAALRNGGSLSHPQGPGSRGPRKHEDHGGGRRLFRVLKEIFDPDDIFDSSNLYLMHEAS